MANPVSRPSQPTVDQAVGRSSLVDQAGSVVSGCGDLGSQSFDVDYAHKENVPRTVVAEGRQGGADLWLPAILEVNLTVVEYGNGAGTLTDRAA
jgi:hypothetical protein